MKNVGAKRPVLHPTNRFFCNVLSYQSYRLTTMSQRYIAKYVARTGKCDRRMEVVIKFYVFDDRDPITGLCFLNQIKEWCIFNGVSERLAFWTLFDLIKVRLRASFEKILVPIEAVHINLRDQRRMLIKSEHVSRQSTVYRRLMQITSLSLRH